ncbi:MAG: OmpA/MotB domain protein [Myxococcales bacterium]|nr:OmpA/MotB domain protein [Myxococcales bacterium]
MKSDDSIPEYSLVGRGKKGSSPSKAPWLLAATALAAAGGAGWYGYSASQKTGSLEAQVKTLTAKSAESEAKAKDLTTKLEAAETERVALASARDELSKNMASKDEELSKLKGTYDQLQDKLKGELKSGDVRLTEAGGKLRVDLVDKVLFNSGEAQVSKRGESVLMKLGTILAGIQDKQIFVSGHTDNTPVGEKKLSQFPTNWELSVARATNVVRFMQDKAQVPGERLTASGYGEFHPVASNKSASGRARNRRIEILLTPSLDPKHIAKSKLRAESKPVEKAETAAAEPRRKKK